MNDRLPARVLHCHIQGERTEEEYQTDGWNNIKEDIMDLGLRQAVDMTRDRMIWKYYLTTSSSMSIIKTEDRGAWKTES